MKLLWDFDGTMFDTYPTIVQSFKELLTHQEVSDEDVLKRMKISSEEAIRHFGIEKKLFDEKFHALEKELHPKDKPPFPYLEAVLKWAQLNVIVTHKSKESTIEILEFYEMKKYFAEIITKDDGYERKPDTGAYAYLHDKYGIDMVIGDRELDLKPARELGIATCAFQNPGLQADYHLSSYKDFFAMIANQL
ncbi:MAG TPA: HAD-IA family hydrolase [Bacillus sp. (in: firmicutes)]|nr:HAD-IA family hydrolase [Bacillus sp. (in: firmicutes)]